MTPRDLVHRISLSAPLGLAWRHRASDRGEVKILIAGIAPCLLMVVAMVVDGGGVFHERNNARWAAQHAAREAAQAVDFSGAYSGSPASISVSRAIQVAKDTLAAEGMQGTVTMSAPTEIRVDAISQYDPIFWLTDIDCKGTATVDLLEGVP